MLARRRQRLRTWTVMAAVVCVPLATFGLSHPASAGPIGVPVAINVISSMNPSTFDEPVTYTATLTASDNGTIDPADTVDFQDGGNDINGCNSQLLSPNGTAG